MAEPVRAIQATQPITLEIEDIRFEDGKLWKPRYNSLIDYSYAPEGFQFEPAFQACLTKTEPDQEIEVFFRIADPGVVFDVLLGGSSFVRWDLLAGFPPVSVEVLDSTHQYCRVLWRRSAAQRSLTSIRIVCRRTDVPESDLDRIEGGVYLVILDPGKDQPELPESFNLAGFPVAGAVRLLGFDGHSRPVYDLFHGDVASKLVRVPAFRAAHGELLDLKLVLDFPPGPYAAARFKVEDGQAVLKFFLPVAPPASLEGVPVGDGDKVCTILWHRPALQEPNTSAFTYNLDAELIVPMLELPPNRSIGVDPTVIEPPPCDAGGICSPPRNVPGGLSESR